MIIILIGRKTLKQFHITSYKNFFAFRYSEILDYRTENNISKCGIFFSASLGTGDFTIQGATDGHSSFQIQGPSDGNTDFQIQGPQHGGANTYLQDPYDARQRGQSQQNRALEYQDPSGKVILN